MHGKRLRTWFVVGILVGLGTGETVLSQAPPSFGPDQAAALWAAARPHLEAVLGDRLAAPPRFHSATAAELREAEQAELEAQLHWQFPDLAGAAFSRSLQATQDLARDVAVARYAEGTATILLMPENLPRIARWNEALKTAGSPTVFQLALVHETVRMVLDRRYHLAERRKACRDAEAFQVLQALVEGRAQWVTWQVARRLKTEADFPLLTRLLLDAPDPVPDPALRAASQQALRQRYWASVQGLAFFHALEEAGLKDIETRAFAHPPSQVLWINRPELYVRAVQSNRVDLDTVLARLEQTLPPAEWTASRQPWTPAMVSQIAAMFGERSRAEALTRSWEEGRLSVWTSRKTPDQQIAVGLTRWESAAAARAYFGFALDLQRQQEETFRKSGGFPKVTDVRSKNAKLTGMDEAVWIDKRLQFASGTPAVPVTMLVVRTGSLVLEFTWHGLPGDTAWAERVLHQVAEGG